MTDTPQQILCARIALRRHGGITQDENDCACEHCVAIRELIALVRLSPERALLQELYDWLYDHADGEGYGRDAGVFAERLKKYLP